MMWQWGTPPQDEKRARKFANRRHERRSSDPQQFNPSLSITCAVRLSRTVGARTRDLVHLDGPISAMPDDAMARVVRNTRTVMGYDQRGQGRDVTELPIQAVREIVANALVHRTLALLMNSKRVEIRLLDDRLVVTSPGGLWGVGEAQLGRPGGTSAVTPASTTCAGTPGWPTAPASSRVRVAAASPRRSPRCVRPGCGPHGSSTGVSFTVPISRHTLLDEDDLGWLSTLPGGPALTSEQRAVLVGMRHGHEWTNGLVPRHFPWPPSRPGDCSRGWWTRGWPNGWVNEAQRPTDSLLNWAGHRLRHRSGRSSLISATNPAWRR